MRLIFKNSTNDNWWIAEGEAPRIGDFLRKEDSEGVSLYKVQHVEHVYRGETSQFHHCEVLLIPKGKSE